MSKPKRRPCRRTDATGRSNREAKHARLHLWVARTPAYRSLSHGARCLLMELMLLYNGTNNGEIACSVRQAGDLLGVHKETAGGYFAELEDRGFARPRQRGTFWHERGKPRVATTWVLTEYGADGQLPTKDFVRWLPPADGVAQKKSRGGKSVPHGAENPPQRRAPPPEKAPKVASMGRKIRPSVAVPGAENPPTTSLPVYPASGAALAAQRADPEGGGAAEGAIPLGFQRGADDGGAAGQADGTAKGLKTKKKWPYRAVDKPVTDHTAVRRRMAAQLATLGYGKADIWAAINLEPVDDIAAITDGFAAGELSADDVAERIGLRRVNGHALVGEGAPT